MAYAESTVGGTSGGQFRVWINSIRTFGGNQSQNYERWRAEGGVKRVSSGSRVWNLNNQATYNIQLGINGVKRSGNFSYDFSGSSRSNYAWGTGTTTAYRNSAGTGFGFTSRVDINMYNSPFATSGWKTVGGSVQTKPRYGDITSVTPSSGLTDETASIVVGWYKRTGTAHIWFRLDKISTSDGTHHKINPASPYTWAGWQTWLQTSMVNTNSTTLYIHYGDDLGSNGSVNRWDTPNTYTITIKNDTGQANPTFLNYDYLDTNAAAVAITGDNQALIQGKSNLEVTVAAADKATANKNAIMKTYSFTVGSYSTSSVWSDTVDVVKDVGIISDVTGTQALSVRAIDSRGNSTTASKQVEILPYADPGFYVGLDVSYTNDFDTSDGLTVGLFNNTTIGSISPLTLGGTDKNAVTPVTGLRFDMSFANNPYTGTWTDIAYTQVAGTGLVNVTKATLETAILSKYNTLAALYPNTIPNTERWYILFELTDKFGPQSFTAIIDVGRPFFRIGANGRLYYKEIEFFSTFSGLYDQWMPGQILRSRQGSFAPTALTGMNVGTAAMVNIPGVINDQLQAYTYLPPGLYRMITHYQKMPSGAKVDVYSFRSDGASVYLGGFEGYASSTINNNVFDPGFDINVEDGHTYTLIYLAYARHASNTTGYQIRVAGVHLKRTDLAEVF